jgi:small subunit ribosomal protein S7
MPRKVTKSLVRDIQPDRLYNSTAVQKLKVQNPLEVFEQAMANINPSLETRSRRVGGANYQIPFEVKGQRQQHLSTMWFVQAARDRSGMSMEDRIAQELIDAYNNTGAAVKKKEDTHRMAEANRAFAHFARS